MGRSSPFTDEFDAVFSHAALHWMRDQEAVLASVHRPLKRGGRFIAEMGGHNPWYFASAGRLSQEARKRGVLGRGDRYSSAAEGFANRPRSLAGYLCRRFSRCRDGGRPVESAERS